MDLMCEIAGPTPKVHPDHHRTQDPPILNYLGLGLGPAISLLRFQAVRMKLLNGLVHGHTRGHVILSPGVIGATANHTCESIGNMVNTAFENTHFPSLLSVQFDGASTSKCSLVLAYMGVYVMEGVFTTARAWCELENHADDVYDAYQAIHTGKVNTPRTTTSRSCGHHSSGT